MKMSNFRFYLVGIVLSLSVSAGAQQNPTVDNPVVVSIAPVSATVAPGAQSAVRVTFKVPKYVWLGAEPGLSRTPPGTAIQAQENPHITWQEPRYPKANVEGVPVKVGVTHVYKGEVTVIVPFTVSENAPEGATELQLKLTYTPGFNAGKLTTHTREPYRTSVQISNQAVAKDIPKPGMQEVPESFTVKPEVWDFPPFMRFMLKEYEEETTLTKAMHGMFLDGPNAQKTLRHAMYPYLVTTLQEGSSYGLGMALLNATPEGVMTGAFSPYAYYNENVGWTGGFRLLTCPAAYHNLQVTGEYSGKDYQKFGVDYENFTLGENDQFGVQTKIDLYSDPRFLFYGVGKQANEEDVNAYGEESLGGTLDFFYLPAQYWRVGVGARVRDVTREAALTDINIGQFDLPGDIPLLDDNDFANPNLNTDATTVGGRLSVIYDRRNQEFNPTKGFYGRVNTGIHSLDADNGGALAANYGRLDVDLRQYFSAPSQKWIILLRNEWSFTTDEKLPFYELPSLGGSRSLRAFGINRFRDQHSFFASMEMRYTMAHVTVMGFPMDMIMSGFLDAGQVFNATDGLDFERNFNWAPGVSLRMVNYPNVGYTVNVAHGQDGFNLSGGISLPL